MLTIKNLKLIIKENKLTGIEYCSSKSSKHVHPSHSHAPYYQALQQYFKDPTYQFKLPINLKGTPFQLKVWKALEKIPSGKTMTYGELARQLKTGPRAVGNACRKNPIPIIIPCHRIVAKNDLGGYSGVTEGFLMNIKIWLLEHEASHSQRKS